MDTLKEVILRLEPKIDLLHHCLGFGRFAKVIRTSDDENNWWELLIRHGIHHRNAGAIESG